MPVWSAINWQFRHNTRMVCHDEILIFWREDFESAECFNRCSEKYLGTEIQQWFEKKTYEMNKLNLDGIKQIQNIQASLMSDRSSTNSKIRIDTN